VEYRLAFSDDSRFLAVASYQDDLAVYDCADWSKHLVTPKDRIFLPRVTWLPGQHVVVLTDLDTDEPEQIAYDVDARTFTEVPLQPWQRRSRTGLHRVTYEFVRGVNFLIEGGDPVPVSEIEHLEIGDTDFTPDETRLYIAGRKMGVLVVDPATATIVDAVPDNPHTVRLLALHPNGEYLAVVRGEYRNLWEQPGPELCVRRLSDGAVILNHWPGSHITGIDWSPDGRWLAMGLEVDDNQNELRIIPIGLPAEPPADLLAGRP
jgi:WD40 repeat protein